MPGMREVGRGFMAPGDSTRKSIKGPRLGGVAQGPCLHSCPALRVAPVGGGGWLRTAENSVHRRVGPHQTRSHELTAPAPRGFCSFVRLLGKAVNVSCR